MASASVTMSMMGSVSNAGDALRSARIVRSTWGEEKPSPLSNTNLGLTLRRVRLCLDGGVKSNGGVGDGDSGVMKVEMEATYVVGGRAKGE